ncbi:MAG: adenylate/guanylate cyclase domain-containing protein [Stellaceae bacterium]
MIPEAAPTPAPTGEAERRQVTVLFCDLAGSTVLAQAVDPEILGDLIRRYQDAVAGAIGRFGGFVAKFMGDGVLAYFSFPMPSGMPPSARSMPPSRCRPR